MLIAMKATPTYMPPEQFAQVLATIPSLHTRKWKAIDVQILFKIYYWCALRGSEAIKLSVEDFDLSINKVYLGKTKTQENDYAAIPPNFVPELAEYLTGKTGPLFPGLNYQIVEVWTRRLGKMLNILAWVTPQSVSHEKTKTHIFRKSIGKDMLYGTYRSKAPISVISKALRHRGKNPIAMTTQYLKVDTEEVIDYWGEA